MIGNFLSQNIQRHFSFEPTPNQQQLIELIGEFMAEPNTDKVLIMNGYAGTGKTSLIGALVRTMLEFKQRCILLAPTGRAAKVLSAYSGLEAVTIHKKIYRQKSYAADAFSLDVNLHSNTLFVVDEASMIADLSYEQSVFGSGRLLNDLLLYVYNNKGCRLILSGDVAQLPPIGTAVSPALDPDYLSRTYLRDSLFCELTQVVRQTAESCILKNATLLRTHLAENEASVPLLFADHRADVHRINGQDLIECLNNCYDKDGIQETIVVTRSNKLANRYNQGIRTAVLFREEEIAVGDMLMVVKNNYYKTEQVAGLDFIANGDMVEIERIVGYERRYDLRFANVRLRFVDYADVTIETKIILDTLHLESAAMSGEANKAFFQKVAEDYAEIGNKRMRYQKMKEDPYFNALQVKFAYAVTCHKAQGGQWKNVFIDHGWMPELNCDADLLRWLYTAFTRAQKTVYLVNFNKAFWGET